MSESPYQPRLLCIRDVAMITGVSRHMVAAWFSSGKLVTLRPHGMRKDYTTQEHLQAFLKESERPNSGPTEDSMPSQNLTERPTSKRVKRTPTPHQNQWRKAFR